MFSIKFLGKVQNSKSIISFLSKLLEKNEECKIISSSDTYELTTGKEKHTSSNSSDVINIELVLRKNLSINVSDLSDQDKLDRYLSEIRNFYEKAQLVEEFKHLPLNMR